MRFYLGGLCLILVLGALLFPQNSDESQRRSATVAEIKDNISQKRVPVEAVSLASQFNNASRINDEEFDWKSRLQFFVLGAQKAGTTSLFKYLGEHPYIAPPLPKETRCWNVQFNPSDPYCEKYFATERFRNLYPDYITGDCSPGYLYKQNVIPRIKNTYLHARFIVSLRDPTERAFSQYKMNHRNGKLDISFDSLCLTELETFRRLGLLSHWTFPPEFSNTDGLSESKMLEMYMLAKVNTTDLAENFASPRMLKSWRKLQAEQGRNHLRAGLYAFQLRGWLKAFPREQFLVFTSNEMSRDTNGVMKRIHAHLGVPHVPLNDTDPMNTATGHSTENPEISNQMRQILTKLFDPFDKMIAVVLEDDKWNDPWAR